MKKRKLTDYQKKMLYISIDENKVKPVRSSAPKNNDKAKSRRSIEERLDMKNISNEFDYLSM